MLNIRSYSADPEGRFKTRLRFTLLVYSDNRMSISCIDRTSLIEIT